MQLTPVLIPAKHFASAKSRLSPPLDEAARVALARGMLTHVLQTVHACPLAGPITVVTDSDEVASVARGVGASTCADPPLPRGDDRGRLGRVVDRALEIMCAGGATRALVLMADLPQLGVEDVTEALRALDASIIVLAPDGREAGMNALGLSLPSAAPTCFGHADSYVRQLDDALARGLEVATLRRHGLSFDLDIAPELAALPPGLLPSGHTITR